MALVFENPPSEPRPPVSPILGPIFGPAPEPAPPTKLAARYGISGHPVFQNTGQSGITPTSPFISTKHPNPSPKTDWRNRKLEYIQRSKLQDFATWELLESGFWISEAVEECALDDVPVHALYEQTRWVDGNIPIGENIPGVWDGKNPVVWNIIKPSLQLATLILQAVPLSPWIDALLHGPRHLIPRKDIFSQIIEGDPDDYSFHLRPHEEFIKAVEQTPDFVKAMNPRLVLAIASAKTESLCAVNDKIPPMRIGGTNLTAVTQPISSNIPDITSKLQKYVEGSIIVFSFEYIEPLFRLDLEPVERLSQQMFLAIVLIHETMHALGLYRRQLYENWALQEPFFEEEDVAELGHSWENSFFGTGRYSGIFSQVEPTNVNPPVLGQAVTTWPPWYEFKKVDGSFLKYIRRRRKERHGPGTATTIWPFHVTFIQSLTQSAFWYTHVHQHGMESFKPPEILGRRFMQTETIPDSLTVLGKDYHSWFDLGGGSLPGPSNISGVGTPERYEQDQKTRLRSYAINLALKRQIVDIEIYKRDQDLVQEWETRRRQTPIPINTSAEVETARLRIVLRRTELEKTAAHIAAQNLTPDGLLATERDNMQRQNLAKDLLEDAINFLANSDTINAFDRLEGVVVLMRARIPLEAFLLARAHSLLGQVGVLRCRDHLHAAIDIFRSLEAMEIPGIDGKWREWIEEPANCLEFLNEKQLQIARTELQGEQEIIDKAVKAMWANEQERAAGMCVELLKTNFMEIRAQAHLLLARLSKTPDKIAHGKAAIYRLQTLSDKAPGVRDWGAMIAAVVWALHPPPSTISVPNSTEDQQRVMVQTAISILNNESGGDKVKSMNLLRIFSGSAYITIRTLCHHRLATVDTAGDDLFRRLEAFQALENAKKLAQRNPGTNFWNDLINSLHGILGGSTPAEWEAAAERREDIIDLERVFRAFAGLPG